MTRFLDDAVPPIPPALQTPPYAAIRRRYRRRRVGTVLAALVAVLTVTAVAVPLASHGPSTEVGTPTPTPSGTALSWLVARVDRAGTGVTLYVSAPAECMTPQHPTATVIETPETVTVVAYGEPLPTECNMTGPVRVQATLSQPLGQRDLRGGLPGRDILVVRDSDLPVIPAPWSEVASAMVPAGYAAWAQTYTRVGGPDLYIVANDSSSSLIPIEDVMLGSRRGVIVGTAQAAVGVRWQIGSVDYAMNLASREGASTSIDDVRAVIAQLTWP